MVRSRWWWRLCLLLTVVAVVAQDGEEHAEEEGGDEAEAEEVDRPSSGCRCDSAASAFICSRLNLSALGDHWWRTPCVQAFPTLLALDVSHNALVSLGDDEDSGNHTTHDLAWRERVTAMDVSFNAFETFRAQQMTDLRELLANDNRLEALLLPADECKLETLDVARNVLKHLPQGLEACSSLSNVDASHNLIEDLPLHLLMLLQTERKSANLTVDLRANPLPEGKVTSTVRDAVAALGCLHVTPDAAECACASFQRTGSLLPEGSGGSVTLRLCVSDMCVENEERWTNITTNHCGHNRSEQVVTTTTTIEEQTKEETTTPPPPQTQPPPSPSQPPPTPSPSQPPSPPTSPSQQPSPPPPRRPSKDDGEREHKVTALPPAEPPLSSSHASERRRRRRLALALILSAVALVLGTGLIAALVVLYRRRRREVLREEAAAARVALKPLLSNTTPRCMRTDDTNDFHS